MDFSGHLDDAKLQIVRAGFTDQLWVPEFGWESADEEAEMTPQPPQLLSAIQLFIQLFIHGNSRIWSHLAAEMQAGKTGVVSAFIRLVLANAKKLNMKPNRIFVLTGMSDDAWKKQTRARMPIQIRENVQHSKGLLKVAAAFQRLREKDHARYLSNILVFLDESHIATARHNQPNLHIWERLQELCPLELWQENNIRVITISATDPSKVLSISKQTQPASVVRLQTTDAYQSIQSLVDLKRIRFVEDFGDVHLSKAVKEIKRSIQTDFENEPLYHIIRPRVSKEADVSLLLREEFPGCSIISWNASSNSKKKAQEDSSSSGFDLDDINEILREEPIVTTFVLLKNMFYAAKTLDDRNVGIMYDRIGGKDDTNLQSLIGRACGYGKSDRTIVYTSQQTVDNYLKCWRELCSNTKAPLLYNIPASHLNGKMVGVQARSGISGKESSELVVDNTFQIPIGKPEPIVEKPKKSSLDETLILDNVFDSSDAAKNWGKTNLTQGISQFRPCSQDKKKGSTHFRYRGKTRKIIGVDETKGTELSWGLGSAEKMNGSPRAVPVLVEGKIKYIVVIKKFMLRS